MLSVDQAFFVAVNTCNQFVVARKVSTAAGSFSFSRCYSLALLPSIICLGRFLIAYRYIFNLWQLRQWVDSLAQWLEHWFFIRADRAHIPRQAGMRELFSYASFLCYGFHGVRWGPVRDRTLLRRKWLLVIINDDFLEERECYGVTLTFGYLPWQISHNKSLIRWLGDFVKVWIIVINIIVIIIFFY